MHENTKNRSGCVDVVVAVFNCANTIERAVRSALADVYVNQVIVVDDASTDNTDSVVRALCHDAGDRLVFEQFPRNKGPSSARNRGIELSKAPWIAILDGDDFFLPGRIASLMDASEGAEFVADDQIQVAERDTDQLIAHGEPLVGHSSVITLDLATFVEKNLSQRKRQRKELGFLKPIMRRSFLNIQHLRYDESLRLGEDFALYVRALAAGAVYRIVPSRTYVSVVRLNSISGDHSKRDLEQLRDSSKALQDLPKLTIAERKLIYRHYASVDARVQWLNVIEGVKMRSLTAFLSPFFSRWTTFVFLVSRLWEQAILRGKRSIGVS
jgi:succinoglycan biosynthesis protein ExoU